ncbi:MAG: YbhN family protein [Syntrophobacteraceae bacterium]
MRKKRFWVTACLGLFVFYETIRRADFKRLLDNLQNIDPVWGLAALAASTVSYLSIAAVLHRLLTGMGFSFRFSVSSRIAFVSATINYIMAVGGLSGMAVKVYLLSREKVPASNTLSISIIHGFLTNTVAVIFVYLGFFYLYSQFKLSSRQVEVGIVILLVAFVLTWGTIQIIVNRSFRLGAWRIMRRLLAGLAERFPNARWIQLGRADTFFNNFNESMTLVVGGGRSLLAPAMYALIDWLTMFLCLKFAFLAVHYPLDNRVLMVGFSVGIFSGLFSITPVSIGIMEGSMAGAFYLMGLDYDLALMATLIYRTAYFFLPLLLSLFFFQHFLVPQERPEQERPSPPSGHTEEES